MKRNKLYGIMAMLIAVMMLMATVPAMANTAYYGKTELIDAAGNKGFGITGFEKHYGSNGNAVGTTAAEVGDGTTAFKVEIEGSGILAIYSKIGHLSDVTADMSYINFDIYAPGVDLSEVEIGFATDKGGFKTNTMKVSDYVDAAEDWKSVTIPMKDFSEMGVMEGNPVEWSYNNASFYSVIKNMSSGIQTYYIKNMNVETKQDEVYDYSYEGDGTIKIIENGSIAAGLTANANSSTVMTWKDFSIDGGKAFKFVPAGTGKFFSIGASGATPYAAVTSTQDYNLVLTLKFEEKHAYPIQFITSTSDFWGWSTGTFIGAIGNYFKQTDDWQTVEIPLSDFADKNISSVPGVGFNIPGVNGELTNGGGSYLPTMYIKEMKLVPNTAVKYSNIASEKFARTTNVLYAGGVVDGGVAAVRDTHWVNFPIDYGQNDISEKPIGDGNNRSQYSTPILQVMCNAGKGVAFNAETAGITNDNYANKYLAFEFVNRASNNDTITVYRSKTPYKKDGEYETVSVRYVPTVGKVASFIIPLDKFSNSKDELPWSATPYIAITAENSNSMWNLMYLDNVKIGEFVDGGVAAGNLTLTVEDGAAKVSADVTNTMTAAYKYVSDNANIISVTDINTDRMIKAEVVDMENATVAAGGTTKVTSERVSLDNLGDDVYMALVQAYKWSDMETLVPLANVEDYMYFVE